MNYLKKLGISLLYILISLLILTFIITTFYYFDLMSDKTLSIFKIIIPVFSMILGGFITGRKSNKSGYIEGLKLGLITSILFIIFNFLAFNNSFKLKYLLFYIILIISSILGSMIGINRKK